MNQELETLRKNIQEEYYDFVEQDSMCELTDQELIDNFWSDAIIEYNENHIGNEVGFIINNHIVEIINY